MQAPHGFPVGQKIKVVLTNGYISEWVEVKEWGEHGIVTATNDRLQFHPYQRISTVWVDKPVTTHATSPHRDRGVAATAGVG